jgi:HPt (histidine-containing phosphotransfer) domain-containing protein
MSQQTSLDGVLNLTEAMSNMDGDHELLAEIVEIFMETAPDQLQSLGRCIAAGDARETAIMAHGMKGGASNFCAGRFVASALKLEMLAKTGSLDGADDLLAAMQENFAELGEVFGVINWDEVAAGWRG